MMLDKNRHECGAINDGSKSFRWMNFAFVRPCIEEVGYKWERSDKQRQTLDNLTESIHQGKFFQNTLHLFISIQMNQSFVVPCENSCMATAMNLYFGQMLFSSREEFTAVQGAEIVRATRQVEGPASHLLMSRVRVEGYLYEREIRFSSRVHSRTSFRTRLRFSRKSIVHYRMVDQDGWHVEAVRIHRGSIQLMRNNGRILPHSGGLTTAQYLDLCRTSGIFHLILYSFKRR